MSLYFDGADQGAIVGSDDNFSVVIPQGSSGTMTPLSALYTFSPARSPYPNLLIFNPNRFSARCPAMGGQRNIGGLLLYRFQEIFFAHYPSNLCIYSSGRDDRRYFCVFVV